MKIDFDPEKALYDPKFMLKYKAICAVLGAFIAATHLFYTDVIPGTPQRRTDECIQTLTSELKDKTQREKINDFCFSIPVRNGNIEHIIEAYKKN